MADIRNCAVLFFAYLCGVKHIIIMFYYSDEEALKLIQKEPSRNSSKENWKETHSGSILV